MKDSTVHSYARYISGVEESATSPNWRNELASIIQLKEKFFLLFLLDNILIIIKTEAICNVAMLFAPKNVNALSVFTKQGYSILFCELVNSSHQLKEAVKTIIVICFVR
jgi:hypothetical protein